MRACNIIVSFMMKCKEGGVVLIIEMKLEHCNSLLEELNCAILANSRLIWEY